MDFQYSAHCGLLAQSNRPTCMRIRRFPYTNTQSNRRTKFGLRFCLRRLAAGGMTTNNDGIASPSRQQKHSEKHNKQSTLSLPLLMLRLLWYLSAANTKPAIMSLRSDTNWWKTIHFHTHSNTHTQIYIMHTIRGVSQCVRMCAQEQRQRQCKQWNISLKWIRKRVAMARRDRFEVCML